MSSELDEQARREVARKARVAVLMALRVLDGEGTRRDILELARRGGGFEPYELAASAPENWREKYGSYVDYRLGFALTNLKKEGLVENPRWSMWRLAGAAANGDADAPATTQPVSARRLAELRAMPERDYLRTPDNAYERVGNELASDLVVLCHACHSLHHRVNGRPRRPKTEPAARRARAAASIPPPATDARSPGATGTCSSDRPSLLRRLLGAG